jgi:dynein heavy chain
MAIVTDVKEEVSGNFLAHSYAAQPDDGAYIHGLYLQGARWDVSDNCLRDMNLKELAPELPVVHVRAIMAEEKNFGGQYECPVYVTALRGGTYVFAANLTTPEHTNKWILSGVALLMTQP